MHRMTDAMTIYRQNRSTKAGRGNQAPFNPIYFSE